MKEQERVNEAADRPAASLAVKSAVAGPRWMTLAAWGIILFGAIVRTRQYLGARSLRYDEARVAFEIAERSFLQMLDAASFIRVAPPGWFVLEKISVMLMGTGELALRLVPFIAGLLALPLFWVVPRRYLGDGAALVCAAMGAVSEHVIYYSSELKQYSSDLLWGLLVLLVVHPLLSGPASRRAWILAGVTGALALWFSQSTLFVMAASGLVLLAHVLRVRPTDLRPTLALGGAWVGSLALNYLLFLRQQTGREELIRYWREGFPPRDEGARAIAGWLQDRLYEYVDIPAGLHSFGLVVFAVAVGLLALVAQRRALASIILLVFAFTLMAAAAQLYPFRDRLLLFTVPLTLIVVAAAVDRLNTIRLTRWLRPGLVLLALLITPSLVRAARMIVRPEGREEIKAVMNYATDRMQPEDAFYLGRSAFGAYTWYATWTNELRNPVERTFQGSDVSVGADSIRAELAALRSHPRVWLIFVDYFDSDLRIVLDQIEAMAERRDQFAAPGALAYLYEFRAAGDTARPAPAAPAAPAAPDSTRR